MENIDATLLQPMRNRLKSNYYASGDPARRRFNDVMTLRKTRKKLGSSATAKIRENINSLIAGISALPPLSAEGKLDGTGSANSTNRKMNTLPKWYAIREISMPSFVKCLKPLYSVLEEKHTSKSNEDPFLKSVLMGFGSMTEETWKKAEKARLYQKALEGKMGDFHEELMGKFPGYQTYPTGHESGCDVGSLDDTTVIEVKNRDNTMNSSSGKSVIANLVRNKEKGRRAILVEVNCPNGKVARFGAPPSLEILNGQQAYKLLSGRDDFFEDLNRTLQHVFANFKTHSALAEAVGTA